MPDLAQLSVVFQHPLHSGVRLQLFDNTVDRSFQGLESNKISENLPIDIGKKVILSDENIIKFVFGGFEALAAMVLRLLTND